MVQSQIVKRFETNRRDIDRRPLARRWSSPALYGLESKVNLAIARHASGAVLDAGCGSMPYRSAIERHATSYDGLDVELRSASVRYHCSITDMEPVSDGSYDTVLCSEVLEHVPDPTAAVAEIKRVLRPDGKLILTVPFLGRLHEEPHDYYRFTKHGLAVLLEAATLELEDITPTGSIGALLGHQISTLIIGATWHVPIVRWLAFALNVLFVVLPSLLLDRALGPIRNKMPLGYVVVASRRAAQG